MIDRPFVVQNEVECSTQHARDCFSSLIKKKCNEQAPNKTEKTDSAGKYLYASRQLYWSTEILGHFNLNLMYYLCFLMHFLNFPSEGISQYFSLIYLGYLIALFLVKIKILH